MPLERNQSNRAQAKSIQGGFFFHPSDEDLSLGTRLRKKPLEGFASGYIYSGSSLGGQDKYRDSGLRQAHARMTTPGGIFARMTALGSESLCVDGWWGGGVAGEEDGEGGSPARAMSCGSNLDGAGILLDELLADP